MVAPRHATCMLKFRDSKCLNQAMDSRFRGNDRLLIYLARAMKQKLVPSGWLEREGRRLDCGPYLSGAMEAKVLLERLPVPRAELCSLTRGHEGGVYNGPQFARNYVSDPDHGVPFLSNSTMLHADFTHADLLKKSDATSPRLAYLRIEEGTTLVSCSGTIGRMVYARPEMSGMWSSQHAIKIVPNPALVRPGYLHAFLNGRFGLPLVTGGTFGAIVRHIEPRHVARVPVPLAPDDMQEQAHRLVTEAAAMRTAASAELRAVIREIEEAAGLPPIRPADQRGIVPDTSLVRASALAGRMDGLFHSRYHRAVLEPLLALPASRRTTVGDLGRAGVLAADVQAHSSRGPAIRPSVLRHRGAYAIRSGGQLSAGEAHAGLREPDRR